MLLCNGQLFTSVLGVIVLQESLGVVNITFGFSSHK